VTAATVREIFCKRCRNPFFFLLKRTGKGRAKTAFFFGMGGDLGKVLVL
jgi:predicted metal-binding membrane protein